MAQLIKTKHGKYLGIDNNTRALKLCGPENFDEWLLLDKGKIVDQQNNILEYLNDELIFMLDNKEGHPSHKITLPSVEKGIGIERNGQYLSDRKGKYLSWVNNLADWEIFTPL